MRRSMALGVALLALACGSATDVSGGTRYASHVRGLLTVTHSAGVAAGCRDIYLIDGDVEVTVKSGAGGAETGEMSFKINESQNQATNFCTKMPDVAFYSGRSTVSGTTSRLTTSASFGGSPGVTNTVSFVGSISGDQMPSTFTFSTGGSTVIHPDQGGPDYTDVVSGSGVIEATLVRS